MGAPGQVAALVAKAKTSKLILTGTLQGSLVPTDIVGTTYALNASGNVQPMGAVSTSVMVDVSHLINSSKSLNASLAELTLVGKRGTVTIELLPGAKRPTSTSATISLRDTIVSGTGQFAAAHGQGNVTVKLPGGVASLGSGAFVTITFRR
jgi:hypothetical protein